MTLRTDLEAQVRKILADQWSTSDVDDVPEDDEVGLGNDAAKLDATVLYADLSDSTGLVDRYKPHFAAEIYKSYLYCAAKVIRSKGGTITAYDGDRIMAVFVGGSKNTAAAECALKIHWAVDQLVQPALKAQYPSSSFVLEQTVGIDTSPLFVAKTGIRGSNDLVWVGRAANYAAKMAALPATYATYISEDVYDMLHESSKLSGDNPKRDMWTDLGRSQLGLRIYGSNYWWAL